MQYRELCLMEWKKRLRLSSISFSEVKIFKTLELPDSIVVERSNYDQQMAAAEASQR